MSRRYTHQQIPADGDICARVEAHGPVGSGTARAKTDAACKAPHGTILIDNGSRAAIGSDVLLRKRGQCQ